MLSDSPTIQVGDDESGDLNLSFEGVTVTELTPGDVMASNTGSSETCTK